MTQTTGLFAPNGRPITHEHYGLACQAPVEQVPEPDTDMDTWELVPGVAVRVDYGSAKTVAGVLYDRAADGAARRWMDDQGNLWTDAELRSTPISPDAPVAPRLGARQPRLDLAHLTVTPATLNDALLELSTMILAQLTESGLYLAIDGQELQLVLAYDVIDPVTERCDGVFLFSPAAMKALPMSDAARAAAAALEAYMNQRLVNMGGTVGELQYRTLTLADLRSVLDPLTPDVLREWDAHLFVDA